MLSKRPISRTIFYSQFISLIISALLLAGCSLSISFSSTPIPPSPTPVVLLASPTPIPPSPTPIVPLASPTPVPPSPTLQPTATPPSAAVNILFASGATAGVVQGTVQPGQVLTYTLGAGQFQPMILILESPNNDVTLGVLEPDGSKLLDPAKKWNRWQWLLPKTGLYSIQVIGGGSSEYYTLTAKVAQRVNFASGATSITLNGTTVKGYVFSYALNCKVGQTMTVTLSVPATTAHLDVFGLASGTLLSASAKVNTWTGVLPATQDYVIEVIPNNGQVVNYSLSVVVH